MRQALEFFEARVALGAWIWKSSRTGSFHNEPSFVRPEVASCLFWVDVLLFLRELEASLGSDGWSYRRVLNVGRPQALLMNCSM